VGQARQSVYLTVALLLGILPTPRGPISNRMHQDREETMSPTAREFWAVVHGMGLGAIFLLAFAGGLAGLWSLRPECETVSSI